MEWLVADAGMLYAILIFKWMKTLIYQFKYQTNIASLYLNQNYAV